MHSDSAPVREISPETVSQVGAGGLLHGIGVAELALDFWAAGWWQRGGALLVVVLGAALLVRGVVEIALALGARELLLRLREDRAPARATFAPAAAQLFRRAG